MDKPSRPHDYLESVVEDFTKAQEAFRGILKAAKTADAAILQAALVEAIEEDGYPQSPSPFHPFRPCYYRIYLESGRALATYPKDRIETLRDALGGYGNTIRFLSSILREQFKANQQVRKMRNALDTLLEECWDGIDRMLDGCEITEVITDARYGTLWDNLIEAIYSLPAESSGKMQKLEKRLSALEGTSESAQIEEDKQKQIEEAQALAKESGKLGAASSILRKGIWEDKGFNSPKGRNGKPYKHPEDALRKQLK